MDKPITLCDRCDIYMSCLLNYDGPACRRNRTVEPTNADRIRAMTDEELAEWLDNIDTAYEPETVVSRHGWLDWLRQEVADEHYHSWG